MSQLSVDMRSMILDPTPKLVLGVASVDHAMVAEKMGHKLLYLGGFAEAAIHGDPDTGLRPRTEILAHIDDVTGHVNIPIMADADDGYGGINQAQRTVEDIFRKTRAAGIHIEDQVYPKRCGHVGGKNVVPAKEFAGKLRAVIDVKNEIDSSLIVMARTDAFTAADGRRDAMTGGDIQEIITRGRMYAEAGADLVWAEFDNPNAVSAEAFAEGMRGSLPPLGLGFNWSPSFKEKWFTTQNLVTLQGLYGLGYRFVFATYPTLIASVLAVEQLAIAWSENPEAAFSKLLTSARKTMAADMHVFTGTDKYQETEARYSESAARRLRDTSSDDFKTKNI